MNIKYAQNERVLFHRSLVFYALVSFIGLLFGMYWSLLTCLQVQIRSGGAGWTSGLLKMKVVLLISDLFGLFWSLLTFFTYLKYYWFCANFFVLCVSICFDMVSHTWGTLECSKVSLAGHYLRYIRLLWHIHGFKLLVVVQDSHQVHSKVIFVIGLLYRSLFRIYKSFAILLRVWIASCRAG